MSPPAPRCIVVTGASRGLGGALAERLAAPGVALRLVARGAEGLAATAARCAARGAEVETAAIDVRDAAALAARLLAWDAARPIDCVVANAGISRGIAPDGAWEGLEGASAQVAVNLVGAMNAIEPLLPAMRARRAGRIVLVASVAAYRGLPDAPGYAASKAGMRAYGEGLRAALAPRGIGVTVLLPGFFDSAMGARWIGPRPLAMTLDRAAALCHRAILRGARRAAFPLPLALLLRLLDALPAGMSDWMVRRMRFRIAPEQGASDQGAPEQGASDQGAPEQGASDRVSPEQGASGQGVPGQAAPRRHAPEA